MATTAPTQVDPATTVGGFTEGARRRLPAPIPIAGSMASSPALRSETQPSPISQSPPPPNPPFVFPARPSSFSAPSSLSRATGRRPNSAIESQERRLNFNSTEPVAPRTMRSPNLPDFSFNPGANLPSENTDSDSQSGSRSPALPDFSFHPSTDLDPEGSLLSPPHSPMSPRAIPSRNGGHRRGGSEFVGGKLRDGGSITVMSTSPTKSDSGFASPNLAPVQPTRRGGHKHRRSAAISVNDLTMILKPTSPNPSRGSSAPSSPADFDGKIQPFPHAYDEPPKSPITPEPETPLEATEAAPEKEEIVAPAPSSPPKPTTRTRVGFSDTLEYIPRPLSLVSTDTSSTITATRPGHSASGSISSIVSAANSMTTDREAPSLLSSPVSSKKAESRPSTAGAVLERTPSLHALENAPSLRRRNSIPTLSGLPLVEDIPAAAPSPIKTPKRWSFFGLDTFAGAGSPTKARPVSSSSSDTTTRATNQAGSSSERLSDTSGDDPKPTEEEPPKTSGKKKKQKKAKSWTSSILGPRKPKFRSQKSKVARRRSLTPPLPRSEDVEDMDDDTDVIDSNDSSVGLGVLAPELSPVLPEALPTKNTTPASDDTSYPMIDLDAALGPFNTPSARDPEWEAAQRAGAPQKRQLHSAAGMRGFSGPGMHYHRRAESAPEMPPFEAARFGITRFGSSSTMADVFEEDEEDEEDDTEETIPTPSEGSTRNVSGSSTEELGPTQSCEEIVSTPTQELELSVKSSRESLSMSGSIKRKGSGSSLDMQPPGSKIRTETSSNSVCEEVIHEDMIYGDNASLPGRLHLDAPETSTSSPSRLILTGHDLTTTELHPVNLPGPALTPASPYSMTQSSSFPSPRSPMSYDAHRVSTAPSSVVDENNFHSLLMGEPGPEVVRISVDVPSLTSSNSTMTRESTFPAGVRPRNMPFAEQRPASFTSTAFGRRRSSLASLSRLISSAHGEPSKLSMEVPFDSEPEKKPKTSTAKRLGRMMQFWKSKDPSES